MDLIGILVAVLFGLAGIFATVFFYMRGKLDKQASDHRVEVTGLGEKYNDQIAALTSQHEIAITEMQSEHEEEMKRLMSPGLRELESRTTLPAIRNIFAKKLQSVSQGSIELDILETSALWSQLFKANSIVLLRATSYISPEIWDDEFMRKYEGEQRKLAAYLREVDRQDYNEMLNRITKKWSGDFPWSNGGEVLERIFIVKTTQATNAATLRKLSDLIAIQSSYMGVRTIHESKLPPEDMKDFGIAFSKDGDPLLYELTIIGDCLYGGKMSCQPEKIKEFVDRYQRVASQSNVVPRNSNSSDVIDALERLLGASGALIPKQVIEEAKREDVVHRCLTCFLSSEVVMGLLVERDWKGFTKQARRVCEKCAEQYAGKNWKDFTPDNRLWYEMMETENSCVTRYVKKRRPRRIIEIGCGPGRLISQILKIPDYDYDEIVGIDADEQMINLAQQRLPPKQFPNVDIFNMRVRNKLPYPNDHFDLCINAMNILGWQRNEEVEWLGAMLRYSHTTFFTVYKRGREAERMKMYSTRPHRSDGIQVGEGGQIQLMDCATNPEVYSWSYEYDDIDRICKRVSDRYESEYTVSYDIDGESSDLLYIP